MDDSRIIVVASLLAVSLHAQMRETSVAKSAASFEFIAVPTAFTLARTRVTVLFCISSNTRASSKVTVTVGRFIRDMCAIRGREKKCDLSKMSLAQCKRVAQEVLLKRRCKLLSTDPDRCDCYYIAPELRDSGHKCAFCTGRKRKLPLEEVPYEDPLIARKDRDRRIRLVKLRIEESIEELLLAAKECENILAAKD